MLCFTLVVSSSTPAFASIHKYPESPTQVMYRSQQSLRDNKDQAWQAVLYERIKSGQIDCLHLRLVGFPGVVEVAHSKPLRISTLNGEVWIAADAIALGELPKNVGEYDLLEVMNHLSEDIPLQLDLPLKNGQVVKLLVPPFVVREWRLLTNKV